MPPREEFTTIALERNLHSALKEIATFRKSGRYDILIKDMLCDMAKDDEQIRFSLERYNISCDFEKKGDFDER